MGGALTIAPPIYMFYAVMTNIYYKISLIINSKEIIVSGDYIICSTRSNMENRKLSLL
jgi:hypothetical protein